MARYEIISILGCSFLTNQGILFPDWFSGILLACQSEVCEKQHLLMVEKGQARGSRERERERERLGCVALLHYFLSSVFTTLES